MNFPLNLALFSFMLIRSPTNIINYSQDPYYNGVPAFQTYEYQNDSILFESVDEPYFSINGAEIVYQVGRYVLDSPTQMSNIMYFSYLPTISFNIDAARNQYYWNELYTPLYIGNDNNLIGDNKSLFDINFVYSQDSIDIYFEMYLNNGYDKVRTWEFLNNDYRGYVDNDVRTIKSYYYDYTIILQAYYGDLNEDSISLVKTSEFYTINLKDFYNRYYPSNITTAFNEHIMRIPTRFDYSNVMAIKINILYQSYKQIDRTSYLNGYNDGFETGIQSELNPNNWIYSFIRSTFNGLSDVLNVEVLPNVTIGTFIAIPLLFAVVMFILSFFKKGG